jgi:uncharacterized phage protein (TIGR01671 family)
MRELRFRAWDRIKRKMLYGVSPFNVHITDENEPLLSLEYSKHDDCEFEQYTGLKDKNGKEIYEGDIVDFVDDGECIGVVEYDAPEFYLNADATNWGAMYLERTRCQRVIGNIHENPELLEEE